MNLKQQLEKYYSSEAVNQSLLKSLTYYGRYAFNKKEEPKTEYLLKGSAFETLLFFPKYFDEIYYVNDVKIPEIVEKIVDYAKDNNKDIEKDEDLLKILNVFEWRMSWKKETRLKKIREIFDKNLKEYKKAEGKIILSQSFYDDIEKRVDNLRNSDVIQIVFDSIKNIRYQVDLYFKYLNVDSKALLDILIEKENGEIWILDLKTHQGNIDNLYRNIVKYGYDFQLHFYRKALIQATGVSPDRIRMFIIGSSTTLENYNTLIEIPVIDEINDKIDSLYEEYLIYKRTNIEYKHLKDNKIFNFKKLKENYEEKGTVI